MTALTHPTSSTPPARSRLLARLLVAVLIVAVAMTAFLIGRSERAATSARPAPPAASLPRNEQGFTGTINSGPDHPAVGISRGLGETAGALGGGHPATGPQADESTCLTVVRHTRIC
jgi:hypothetical protein